VEPSAARLRVAVAVTVAVQVVVFGGLALLAGWLSAQRGPSGRPDRLTLVALGLLSAFALAATARRRTAGDARRRVDERRGPVLLLTRPMSLARRARL
jgi:hypothetical protein